MINSKKSRINKKLQSVDKNTFASLTIHYIMLRDIPRMMAYKTAILKYAKNKTIIDIGTGTGILACFCITAGAKKVFAVEESSIINTAKKLFLENSIQNNVELISSNSKRVNLNEKADVIVHEIIGNDPFEENILTTIYDAKKRLLKPNGQLLPYKLESYCVGFQDEWHTSLETEIKGLAELYGVGLNSFINDLQHEINSTKHAQHNRPILDKKILLTTETLLFNVNFNEDFSIDGFSARKVETIVTKTGVLNGVLIYFKAHLDPDIVLSNSPFSPQTHWVPKVIYFDNPKQYSKGEKIRLKVSLNNAQKMHIEIS